MISDDIIEKPRRRVEFADSFGQGNTLNWKPEDGDMNASIKAAEGDTLVIFDTWTSNNVKLAADEYWVKGDIITVNDNYLK